MSPCLTEENHQMIQRSYKYLTILGWINAESFPNFIRLRQEKMELFSMEQTPFAFPRRQKKL